MATTFSTGDVGSWKARFAPGTGAAQAAPAGYWGRADTAVLANGGDGKAAGRAGDERWSRPRPVDRALEDFGRLRFNNGAAVDDEDEVSEEEEGQGADAGTAAGSGDRKARVVAAEEAEAAHGDGGKVGPEAVARDVKAEMVAGGGKVGAEAARASEAARAYARAGAETERRSSPRLANGAIGEEVSGGSNGQLQGGLAPRKRKVITKRTKLQADGAQEQNDMAPSPCQSAVLNGTKRIHLENENLKLQLALKTKELELEENRRLKLELILKTKEYESLLKQNEELKAENEQLRKTAKPPRARRFCRSCQSYEFHDFRNCPERQQAARSSEEEDSH